MVPDAFAHWLEVTFSADVSRTMTPCDGIVYQELMIIAQFPWSLNFNWYLPAGLFKRSNVLPTTRFNESIQIICGVPVTLFEIIPVMLPFGSWQVAVGAGSIPPRKRDRRHDLRIRLEAGAGSDRYAVARRSRGPLAPGDSGFRFNRGVDAGHYRVASAKIELHPDVNAAFVRPGEGGSAPVSRSVVNPPSPGRACGAIRPPPAGGRQ